MRKIILGFLIFLFGATFSPAFGQKVVEGRGEVLKRDVGVVWKKVPVKFMISVINDSQYVYYWVNPGDSVISRYMNKYIHFRGTVKTIISIRQELIVDTIPMFGKSRDTVFRRRVQADTTRRHFIKLEQFEAVR